LPLDGIEENQFAPADELGQSKCGQMLGVARARNSRGTSQFRNSISLAFRNQKQTMKLWLDSANTETQPKN
jgi:hypothetical protein